MYTVSHGTLVLRSEKQYKDVNYECKYDNSKLTIDIIFNSVDFISIPEQIKGVEISKKGDKYIFNNNEKYYVTAANCFVGTYSGEDENNIWTGNLTYDEISRI